MTSLRIGPANSAGQATSWALAARNYLGIDSYSFANRLWRSPQRNSADFEFVSDFSLPDPHYPFRLRAVRNVIGNSTHLLWDGFKPILRTPRTRNFEREVAWLKSQDLKIGLVAHGSEIRDPDVHIASNENSYFKRVDARYISTLRAVSARNRRDAVRSGLPLFVSTPDLLLDLPSARWLPVTLPLGWDVLTAKRPAATNPRLRVAHLPSTRTPSIKGSEDIEKVLDALDRFGHIEWVRSQPLRNSQVRDFFSSVDVVVDQIGTNSYGTTSVEAMSVGAIAVAELSGQVKSVFGGYRGPISCTAADLAETLYALSSDSALRSGAIADGYRFVEEFHSGRYAATEIAEFVFGG